MFDDVIAAAPGVVVLTGFDSAWADKQPGAIAAIVVDGAGTPHFFAPRCVHFCDARKLCLALHERAGCHVLAIDQPTIVRNDAGSRPVERALMPLMVKFRSGVQPAYRLKQNGALFGPGAPICDFLDAIRFEHQPTAAVGARSGEFVIEVFPGLALLELVPDFLARRTAGKYNPRRKATFSIEDWILICRAIARYSARELVSDASEWADDTAKLAHPRKADQDRLDAAVCAVVAHAWWRHGAVAGLTVGDASSGYVATLATGQLRGEIEEEARKRGVPCNGGAHRP